VGAGHSHALYVHEHSPFHRLVPEVKIAAAVGMITCVAITPRQEMWAFALYAVIVMVLISISRVSPLFVLARLAAVAPFVIFALFIPFIGTGDTTTLWGIELSIDGLWATWNIIIKAVLGASISIVLTATTEVPDIIRGLGVLRVPALFTSIATFMIRYLELITEELGRMRVAMTARGYDPRWLYQARPIATSAGAMFVRSYERSERIHSAMLARGFTGEMPIFDRRRAGAVEWASAALLVGVFAVVALMAFTTS
jgi:cobalt/nickel transport system permease protein